MQKRMAVNRMVLNAAMIAVYVVLSMPFMVISVGGLKITFEHFPVVLSAVVLGPVDAMFIGGIGELINQLTSFGFTPTTLLWILPIVIRGGFLGLCGKVLKKEMSRQAILRSKVPIIFLIVCVLSGLISSIFNTLALYVDSKMFGYYTFALVFGALTVRLLLSVITSVLIVFATKPILHAIKHESFK